jgi:hypothetical protein
VLARFPARTAGPPPLLVRSLLALLPWAALTRGAPALAALSRRTAPAGIAVLP